MTTLEAVIDRPEELTAEWLSAALREDGHDLEVSAVRIEPVGTGQMGATYRLHVTYRGRTGPASLIVKMAGEDEAARVLVAPGYAAEVGFYTVLSPTLDIRTPRAWYGSITTDQTRFTLLLEDAAPSAPGTQAHGCTVEQAAACLQNLVGLHAPRWCDPGLWPLEFLLRPEEDMANMLAEVMSLATKGFIERYDGALDERDAQTLRDVSDVIDAWQLAGTPPFSVIHGDYRLDNLLFHPESGSVTAVDWQTAAIGPPLRDVAYFLGTSLEIAERRTHEEGLVAGYHAGLLGRDIADYGADRCWRDYRLGQLQGPMITVIGCMYAATERSAAADAMFLAMASRSCTAVRDLRSIDLI